MQPFAGPRSGPPPKGKTALGQPPTFICVSDRPGKTRHGKERAAASGRPGQGMNGSDSGTGTGQDGAGAGSWWRCRRQTMPPPNLPDMATGWPQDPANVADSPASRSSEGRWPWPSCFPPHRSGLCCCPGKKNPDHHTMIRGCPCLSSSRRRPPDPRGEAVSFQAGILTSGSSLRRVFPTLRSVTLCGVRPRLQRRARLRFPRSSLLFHDGT